MKLLGALEVYIIAFMTVFLAEIGDKTQLVTLTLSCRYPPRAVLAGALSALAAITGIAVLLGDFFASVFPARLILFGSAIFFIITGIFIFVRKEAEKKKETHTHGRQIVMQTFLLVFFAELGDKTQLTVIALTAAYGNPLPVFLGAMTGQLLNHGAAACLGSRFLKKLPAKTMTILSASVFLFFGVLFLVSAL